MVTNTPVMRPAEFEGFYYLCPANEGPDGWHHAHPARRDPQSCALCGRLVRRDGRLDRWIYAVEFLVIEEEPV